MQNVKIISLRKTSKKKEIVELILSLLIVISYLYLFLDTLPLKLTLLFLICVVPKIINILTVFVVAKAKSNKYKKFKEHNFKKERNIS